MNQEYIFKKFSILTFYTINIDGYIPPKKKNHLYRYTYICIFEPNC